MTITRLDCNVAEERFRFPQQSAESAGKSGAQKNPPIGPAGFWFRCLAGSDRRLGGFPADHSAHVFFGVRSAQGVAYGALAEDAGDLGQGAEVVRTS